MPKSPRRERLILADDPGHGIDKACFDKILRDADFAKLEVLISPTLFKTPENREAFRGALRYQCWLYYKACLPEAKSRWSRAALKQEAKRAAKLAESLAASVERLRRSDDPAVSDALGDLAKVSPLPDGVPSAPTAPGFVRFLDQLARRLGLLASALPDDIGGRPQTAAFDELVTALAGIYFQLTKFRQLAKEFPQGTGDILTLIAHGEPPGEPATASTRGGFFRFVGGVVDMLRSAETRLPAARLGLPANNEALRKRLERLAKKAPSPAVKLLAEEEALDLAELLAKSRHGDNPGA